MIWGMEPARSAYIATKTFKYLGAKKILVPGCAYGRNSLYFAKNELDVIGLDSSPVAIDLAKEIAAKEKLKITYEVGNVYQLPYKDGSVDAVFDRGLLHLMMRAERRQAISEYRRVLSRGGVLFLTAFSIDDKQYGKGRELEEDTFDSMNGRPAHFFNKDRISGTLNGWHIAKMTALEVIESHGKGRHRHNFLIVVATPSKNEAPAKLLDLPLKDLSRA